MAAAASRPWTGGLAALLGFTSVLSSPRGAAALAVGLAAWPSPRPELNAAARERWELRHKVDLENLERLCSSGPLDVLLLGDSISERWLRPSFGGFVDSPMEYTEAEKLPSGADFQAAFGQRAGVAAIGGDTTLDLGWRLEHGLRDAVERCAPRKVHLLVGTNDLAKKTRPGQEWKLGENYRPLVEEILAALRPGTPLVLQLLMPRGSSSGLAGHAKWLPKYVQWTACEGKSKSGAMVPAAADTRKDCAEYFPAITAVNRMIAKVASDLAASGRNVASMDCTKFYLDAQGRLSKDVFPDLLHPNAAGYSGWMECLRATGK